MYYSSFVLQQSKSKLIEYSISKLLKQTFELLVNDVK